MKVKAYVLHSKMLQLREQSMNQMVEKFKSALDIECEIITDHDIDTLSVEEIRKYIDLNKNNKSEFYDSLLRNIHIKNVSNALKHHVALSKARDESQYDFYIVIEDDALFGDDMPEKVKHVLQSYDENKWDMLFMGLPSLTPISDQIKVVLQNVFDSYKVLPSCDSYIIHKSNIQKIADAFLPIRFITNIHMSYLSSVHNFKTMYTVPNIFIDGSKMGVYLSSLETNNRLFLNPEYNQLSSLVRSETYKSSKPAYTDEQRESIEKLLESMRFKNHPDIQLLAAMYFENIHNFQKAKEIYQTIYNICSQNGCIINNESEILTRYINIHKHFQDESV